MKRSRANGVCQDGLESMPGLGWRAMSGRQTGGFLSLAPGFSRVYECINSWRTVLTVSLIAGTWTQLMALHSYCRCWLHIVWATLDRRPLLSKPAAVKRSGHLNEYAREKEIYMQIHYVNADHVHALVDLPTNRTIEEVVQLLNGSSSHWVNEQNLVPGKFGGQRGY